MVIRGPVSGAWQQLSDGTVFNGKKIIGDYFVQHMEANMEDFLSAGDVAAFFSQELEFDELCSRYPGKPAFLFANASLFEALHVVLRSLSTALFVLFFTASCGRSRSSGLDNEQCDASMERDASDKKIVPRLTLSEQSGGQKKDFERPGETAIQEDSTIDESVPHNLPGYRDHTHTDEWICAAPKDKEDTDDDDDDDDEEEEEDEEEEAVPDDAGDQEDYLEGEEEEGDDEGADDNGDADENDGEEGDEDEDEVDEDDDGQEEEEEEDDEDGDQDDEDEGESEEDGEPPSKKRK